MDMCIRGITSRHEFFVYTAGYTGEADLCVPPSAPMASTRSVLKHTGPAGLRKGAIFVIAVDLGRVATAVGDRNHRAALISDQIALDRERRSIKHLGRDIAVILEAETAAHDVVQPAKRIMVEADVGVVPGHKFVLSREVVAGRAARA